MAGQATAPAVVPVVTKKASELGCALNVNLDTGAALSGSGAATDDTALLQAFLATASAANPILLVMDGAALITGLKLSPAGYTTIQGSGDATGFFLKSGSNNDGIHNRPAGYVNDPGPPVPARTAQQVQLLNFRLNGNRGDGHSGNSTTGDAHGAPWLFGINLMDMEQITIDRVTVLHSSTYGIRLSNVGHATVTRCRLEAFTPNETVSPTNTDGIHVNGPSNDIAISGCYFRTGDDAIALNAPEGHSGNIERVTASDCVFDQSQTMMRFYANSRSNLVVSDVTVSGFTGTTNVLCFIFGLEDRGAPLTVLNAIRNVLIHNCQVTGAYLAFLQDNVQDLTFRDVEWIGTDAPYGMVATANHPVTIGSLTLQQCTMRRTAGGSGAVCVVDLRGLYAGEFPAQVNQLTLDGLTCLDATGAHTASLQALLLMSTGSQVNLIDVATVDSRKIPRIVPDSEWPQVLEVTGEGLLQSGWAVPDSKVAQGTAYVSEETLLATVHREGVPHTLLGTGRG